MNLPLSAATVAGPSGRRPGFGWAAALLLFLALAALYRDTLPIGFLNDDHVFLEQVRQRDLAAAILAPDPLSNYYRPVSRQLYFFLIQGAADGRPMIFHLVNFALFLAGLALLGDLLSAFTSPAGVMVGVTYFALLHGQRALLLWISCAQDLLALVGTLAALALYRRGRLGWATFAYGAAAFSKESALPLPALLLLWERWERRRSWSESARPVAGMALVALAWCLFFLAWRASHPGAGNWLTFGVSETLASYVHMAQSFLFLEHPLRALERLFQRGPSWLALAPLSLVALWLPGRPPAAQNPRRPAGLRFAAAWCLLFGIPLALVCRTWSAYYYTLAAAGAALAVAVLAARMERGTWIALAAGLLWLHAGAGSARAFAVVDRPWVWTSHLTPYYFERAARYVRRLSGEMRRILPAPPPHSRLFFATLPSFAGFQMGNGALLRTLYRDSTLRSYFYSQFSESTAAHWPCDFFYWDGLAMKRLYPSARGRFTQVGGDLLLMDHPAGARHALHRALAGGEEPREARYWLGWALLMAGERDVAEEAWRSMGARDDPVRYWRSLLEGQNALGRGDSAAARRAWVAAVPHHIGRPEAHRRLGALLFEREPKYALLELKVAAWLDAEDLSSRRMLALGLSRLGMHEQARAQLEELLARAPEWRADAALQAAQRRAGMSGSTGIDVVEFSTETKGGEP